MDGLAAFAVSCAEKLPLLTTLAFLPFLHFKHLWSEAPVNSLSATMILLVLRREFSLSRSRTAFASFNAFSNHCLAWFSPTKGVRGGSCVQLNLRVLNKIDAVIFVIGPESL